MSQERLQIHGAVVDDPAIPGDHPGDGLWSGRLDVGVKPRQTLTDDVQRKVLVALHRQGVAQPLQVRLRIATVPIANTVRADESLTLEIANL